MSFENFYTRIDKISVEIIKACHEENYDDANKLLAQRLTLLKTLAAKASVLDDKSVELKKYYQYLTKLKEHDDKQKLKLLEARTIEIQRNSEQNKKNKAINTYKKFK